MAGLVARTPRRRPQFHDLSVVGTERLTERAVALTLDVPPQLRATFDFLPGQHLTLRARLGEEEVRRDYSLCLSRGRWRRTGRLRIAAARVDGGLMSAWLATLAPGGTVAALPPRGEMVLHPDPGASRHVVAVAGGSGVTPVLSILATLLEEEPGSRAGLVLVNRDRASIMFRHELAELESRYAARLDLVHVLTREPVDRDRAPGRLDDRSLAHLLDRVGPVVDVDDFYLCGPAGLVRSARTVIEAAGVGADRVHDEVFYEPTPLRS